MDKINLTTNLSGDNPQITFLEGTAPDPINPNGYTREGGDLQSVLDFYEIRKKQDVIKDKTSLLTISQDDVSLKLESDLGLPTYLEIQGSLSINTFLLELGIFGVDSFDRFKTYSQTQLRELANKSAHIIGKNNALELKRISQMKTKGDYQRENKNNDKGKIVNSFSAEVQLVDEKGSKIEPYKPETMTFDCQLFNQSVKFQTEDGELDYDNFNVAFDIMITPGNNGDVGIWFDAQDAFEKIKKAKKIVLEHFVNQFHDDLPRFNVA